MMIDTLSQYGLIEEICRPSNGMEETLYNK